MSRRRVWRGDLALAVVLALAAGVVSFAHAQRLDPKVNTKSMWFQADAKDFYSMMTDRQGSHGDTKVHPLFSIAVYSPVKLLRAGGLEPMTAVRTMLALMAAAWIGVLFAIMRLMGCRRLDAVLFSLLALASAASVFWFAVPESYPFGSLSIVLVLALVAWSQRRRLSTTWYELASAGSLGMTVTNWMAGIAAALVKFPRRRAVQVTANAFAIVMSLAIVQKVLFPRAHFMLENLKKGEFILHPDAGGPPKILNAFVFHAMVMPAIRERRGAPRPTSFTLLVQPSTPGSGTPWGGVAIWLWALLLGLGCWAAWARRGRNVPLRRVLGLVLAGQLALHLVYGEETFLYSLHWLPLLVILAAFSTLTRARPLALTLAAALLLCAGINNRLQFEDAAGRIDRYLDSRRQAEVVAAGGPAARLHAGGEPVRGYAARRAAMGRVSQ